ncbi:MAG: GTP-binding protein [Candidimonas sp.]|nr:GTP-binding protein [Candidimonas sp.]NYT44697.1 GTP-binding protein [Alcaligenaceae bacterium]
MQKIPITVVSGFLGSGKTSLLNRLLRATPTTEAEQGALDGTLVLMNELGAIGLDHRRSLAVTDTVVLLESGCLCCAVRGELVQALRQAFMDALHKKIPAFSRVLIETTGIADPAAVMYTLKYEPFLAERYRYAGCITVVDGCFGAMQLEQHREAVQQAVLADVLVISKTDLTDTDSLAELEVSLGRINPMAVRFQADHVPVLAELLHTANSTVEAPGRLKLAPLWTRGALRSASMHHGGVGVLTLSWSTPLQRSRFVAAVSALQELEHPYLLRLKGSVWFQNAIEAVLVHGVHKHLYPLDLPAPSAGDTSRSSFLVVITRDGPLAAPLEIFQRLLPGAHLAVSPEGNFVDS